MCIFNLTVSTLTRLKIWWSQARQSKKAIEWVLGFGLVWVSVNMIGKEPMLSWGEVHQHNGLKVIKNWSKCIS